MVQNLRSRLSQAAVYPGLGIYTRINSSFRVRRGQSKPRLIFSRINGPMVVLWRSRDDHVVDVKVPLIVRDGVLWLDKVITLFFYFSSSEPRNCSETSQKPAPKGESIH